MRPWTLYFLALRIFGNYPPPPSDVLVFLVAQTVENLPAMQETWVRSLGWDDPLEKGMATHSSILALRIPCIKSLMVYGPQDRKESDMTE